MARIDELIASIETKFKAKEFDKFIHEMNFPRFKGFSPNTKLLFNFPLTVIVGPNGGGKSSVLHAAWGMPLKSSTSRFWFSTPVDPINFSALDQNRYWYSHYVKAIDVMAQSRKMCGNKRNGYWEPTRPSTKEGMAELPQRTEQNAPFLSPSGDRWSQVDRNPHYINSKAESSAFDRFFYSVGSATLEERQNYFVKYSRQLKMAVDYDWSTLYYYGVERIKANFKIDEQQLAIINKILQKKYKSARYVIHSLYDKNFSPSVIFETSNRKYSECFAGSGELAVVNCVRALDAVQQYDLLLLDEPETSLHPGAQKKLLEYILELVKKKHLQVIISTHSPTFVDLLPRSALIVLDESPEGFRARQDPTKSSAFMRLGHQEPGKVTVLTEDKLLAALAERALELVPQELKNKVVVFPAEVGASEMLSNQVRAYVQTAGDVLMLVDGDQSSINSIVQLDVNDISETAAIEYIDFLKQKGVSIVGSHQDLKLWINWCKERLIFLEQVCPEQLFLELLMPNHPLLNDAAATNAKFKSAVKTVLDAQGMQKDSTAQAVLFKYLLGAMAESSPIRQKVAALSESLRVKLVNMES